MNSRSTLLLEHHLKELNPYAQLLPAQYRKMAVNSATFLLFEGVDHPGYS